MNNFLTEEFWRQLFQKMTMLLIQEGPKVLLIIILTVMAFKGFSLLMKQLKKWMLHGAQKRDTARFPEVEKRIETLLSILKGLGDVVIWALVIMIMLKKIGIDIGPLIAGAGIVGVAVGFGSQELVRDMIAGFFILLENHIRVGDVAVINGVSGLVEQIGLRTILLRDLSGTVHVFQNGKVNSLSNMTKDWSAIVLEIGVAYKEETDRVTQLLGEVGEQLKQNPEFQAKLLGELEIFGVDKFADSAVVLKVRLKTKPGEQWAIGREFRRLLKQAFDAQNIEIPFPHVSLYWGEQSRPMDLNLKNVEKTEA